VHFSENSENSSGDTPRVERFSENGEKVHLDEKSAPKVVTTPLSWESDGLEIEYMPSETKEGE